MQKFFLTIIGTLFSFLTYGQYFVNEGQPCAIGREVKLDTISYLPDGPLPFDRCFNLKLRLSSNAIPDYFTITPIDKFGRKDVRKRDYRVFLKSLFPEATKSARSKYITWGQFKDPQNRGFRLFKNIKQVSEGKTPDYIFRISPLDPARNYQLVVINHVPSDLEKIRGIENTILGSATAPTRITKTEFSDAKQQYEKIVASYRSKKFNLGYRSFLEFFSDIDDCRNKAFLDYYWRKDFAKETILKHDKKITENKREFKFFLVPAAAAFTAVNADALLIQVQANVDAFQTQSKQTAKVQDDPNQSIAAKVAAKAAKDAAALTLSQSKERFFTLSTSERIESISIRALLSALELEQVKDINGGLVNYFDAGNYDIYVMLVDTVTVINNNGKSNPYINHDFVGHLANVTLIANPAQTQIDFNFTSIIARDCNIDIATAYAKYISANTSFADRISTALSCLDQNEINSLLKEAVLCPCEDKGVKDITQRDDLLRNLSIFFNFSRYENEIRSGLSSTADPSLILKADDIAGRMANLKTTINQLKLVQEFVAKVEAKYSNGFGGQFSCLKTIEADLTRSFQELKSISDMIAARHQYYTGSLQLHGIVPLANGTSSLTDLKAASKFRIVPDFGLIGIFKGNELSFQDLSPYLGFHINFRSIDKDIEMGDVKYKSWRHYFSFMAGITLKSLKIEGKREDFFSDKNLITGIGFRLNNYLRITGGLVWFKTISTNPLSSDKPLGFSGFTGLSLDIELRDLFNGLNKLF